MCCGLLLLFLYVANLTYSAIYSRSSVQSFWAAEASAQTQAGIKPQSSSGLPDFSLWSSKRIRAYRRVWRRTYLRRWEFSTFRRFVYRCRSWRERTT